MLHCFLHRWMHVQSTNGHHDPFTGALVKRHDRYCRDCNKMQIKLDQFPIAQQRELLKMTKTCPTADWVNYTENDAVDKLTMKWLKNN